MVNPPGPAGPGRRGAGPDGTFGDGRTGWLGHLGNVRNVVRQEMISRQLGRHLPAPAARILDVGAGELDPPPPSDPAELAALLDVEERLGATDPYRQLGQLAHLILRKTQNATARR